MLFRSNLLTGSIPASLYFLGGCILYFNNNNLENVSRLPTNQVNEYIEISRNKYDFSILEAAVAKFKHYTIYPQKNIPLYQNENLLYVSAGGILLNNTYNWYRYNTLIKSVLGDSTLSIETKGKYSVVFIIN